MRLLENVLRSLGCLLFSKGALTEIPYVRGHIRSLINSGLCPYITAPLRTAATASLGQITLSWRDVWSEFIKQNPEDLLEIKRKFEAKKRGLTAKPTEATIPYPPSLFKTYIEKGQVKSMSFTWVIMESIVCLKNCFIISGSNRSFSFATLTV
jgi:hypothetical protein